MDRDDLNQLSHRIIGAAMTVHSRLGPGLLESAYQACLAHELRDRGLQVQTELELPIHYDGVRIDAGYRLDMFVEGEVILELKAVESLTALHEAQLLSYLRLSGRRLGLLLNFNVEHLRDGIRRLVNG
jgi:GxxExxY protein